MGERRLTYHAPVGISVCEPLDIAGVMGDASASAQAIQLRLSGLTGQAFMRRYTQCN